LGDIHYALLLTDRYSQMTYLYPLKNLTSDICKQLEYFFAHLGMTPKRLITDFDTKLIDGQARDYLNSSESMLMLLRPIAKIEMD